MATVGILHPGAMGATLGAEAAKRGARAVWVSAGRSPATRRRAEAAGLAELPDLAALAAQADIVISICPPHGAEALADAVIAAGFRGLYCDANAISPERACGLAARVHDAGGRFVDAGVVGPPAREAGTTRLFLSGPEANAVAALYEGSFHEPVLLGEKVGAASALKMCFAGWNKGAIALALAVCTLARAHGVDDALRAEWARSRPGLAEKTERDAVKVSDRAWRWTGEMDEIAATFADIGLPRGFHEAAGAIYAAMSGFKDAPEAPSFAEVLDALSAGKASATD